MKRTERLAEIKKIVDQRGRVELNELSDLFQVSVVTIRKDVEILSQRSCIKRVHGAAVSLDIPKSDIQDSIMGVHIKYDIHKEQIGEIAASRIKDSGWIFVGQGTTCYYVARELAKLEEVNVLTNNLLAAQALAQNKRANVVVTGGNMIHSHLYVAGEMFMRNLDNLHISIAFMGVGGADINAGYTVNYSTELTVFETIQKLTDNLIMVLDSTKFDRTTFLSLGKLEYADMVITDNEIPEKYLNYYQDHGVTVLKPDLLKNTKA